MRSWSVATIIVAASVSVSGAAFAADMPLKARPQTEAPPPAPSWTGFYVGGQIGGGWRGDHSVTYAGNDLVTSLLVNGASGFVGQQPVASHRLEGDGVSGGIELGYNWQIDPHWLAGLEADFSGSDISGSGSGTSALQTAAPPFNQTVSSSEKIDWWGTVRARFGWLPRNDVLLFGTGGFAYGHVKASDNYMFTGTPPGTLTQFFGGVGFTCTVNTTCFSGSNSDIKTGWTVGGGGEWRFTQNWSAKVEYLYVNLGSESVTVTALAAPLAAPTPASYTANFGRTDFHVVRAGVNYHF